MCILCQILGSPGTTHLGPYASKGLLSPSPRSTLTHNEHQPELNIPIPQPPELTDYEPLVGRNVERAPELVTALFVGVLQQAVPGRAARSLALLAAGVGGAGGVGPGRGQAQLAAHLLTRERAGQRSGQQRAEITVIKERHISG